MTHGASVKRDFDHALLPYQVTGIGHDAFLRNWDPDFAVPVRVTIRRVGQAENRIGSLENQGPRRDPVLLGL
jgi:hypothetical protein